jgi:nucleotide-binding universal stress UspA family protein
VVAQHTPARALHELAERDHVDLVVVGSSHVGALGRVMPGSTGERLLHGSPCPVAIVPRDHRETSGFRRVGVAFNGSPEAEVALRAAVEIARATGAALRVIRVLDPVADTMPKRLGGEGYLLPREDLERKLRRELDDTVGGLPATLGAEAILLTGDAGHALAEESGSLDLLITGSRGYGPLRAVMAGAVTGRLLRDAACPVIVLPRGVGATGGSRCSAVQGWPTTDAVAQGAA